MSDNDREKAPESVWLTPSEARIDYNQTKCPGAHQYILASSSKQLSLLERVRDYCDRVNMTPQMQSDIRALCYVMEHESQRESIIECFDCQQSLSECICGVTNQS